jgi:hypothetical protein
MFRWYKEARKCYAYLPDVSSALFFSQSSNADDHTLDLICSHLAPSKWFTRGWTIQEMIALTEINFYGEGRCFIETRQALGEILETNTQILAVGHDPLGIYLPGIPAARRMSWAASRTTTRP